ncbi:MAG: RNA methyltransferase [Saprospiraceae bacterium]|nr:RNA methyltransferase [Saprospiraceae bacterium]
MISKAQIKDIKALHQPKFRQIYNKFIAEGDKVCIEFLKSQKFKVQQVYITKGHEAYFEAYTRDSIADITIVSPKEMEQLSALKTATGILLLIERSEDNTNVLLNNSLSAIYLDGVQDPGNVGTIIRIADWFGIDVIIRSRDSADYFNPKVVQATMGSMVNVHLCTSTLDQLLPFNRMMYGTFVDGLPVSRCNLENNAIVIMGNEGKGISYENEQYISGKISIQGSIDRIAESLNVSVAAGIICAAWKNVDV